MRRPLTIRRSFPVAVCLLALLGALSQAIARDVPVPGPKLDADAVREFPQAVFDKITDKITGQMTFAELGTDGVIRWWPRTIELKEFVKSPSQTHADTLLYAMRYEVSVVRSGDPPAAYITTCQVVVVFQDGGYDEPTVVCEPLNLDRPEGTS
jgi:hypothetical protein